MPRRCWSRTASRSPCRACPRKCSGSASSTRKTSPDFLMVVNLISPDHSLDRGYISNYALTQVRDRLARARRRRRRADCSARATMRCGSGSIPGRAAALDLTAGEIVDALRAQNVQVAAGTLGQPPYDTGQRLPAQCRNAGPPHRSRSNSPTSSSAPIARRPPGARVATSRGSSSAPPIMPSNTYLSGEPTVILGVFQRPGSERARRRRRR